MKRKITLSPASFVPGPQGPRPLVQSVDYCTRCNACVQSCPSYLLRQEEAFSPRGRNQIVRLLLERKIKISDNPSLLKDTICACLLCARCTAACAGALPVPDHMLALRRAMHLHLLPKPLMLLLRLGNTCPEIFERLVRTGYFFRRFGRRPIRCLGGLLATGGLAWLKHADDILPQKPSTLKTLFKKQHIALHPKEPDIVYLPSFEASYLMAQTALKMWQLLQPKKVYVLWGQSSGLLEYLYGDKTLAVKQFKRLLLKWEKLGTRKKLPLITDSIELYGFLKHSPVLFATLPGWQKRAQALADHMQFVSHLRFTKTVNAKRCALDASTVLYPAGEAAVRAQKIFKTHFGKNFVECEYSHYAIAAAGLAFVPQTRAEEMVLENVKDVARRQIQEVYCLSGLAALELNASLRRHYPQAQAKHMVFMQDEP